ncbi:MAG TPA: serine hydrolase domain-containing protein [Steroidobacteraceae bacterium]|nr:serine hydrolase domain-containing protein [Steroidobacteraceae bacterium]
MTDKLVLNRRECFTGLATAALLPLSGSGKVTTSPNAGRPRWAAVQQVLDAFVAEGIAAGTAVAIAFGDEPPAYPSAGTLAFGSAVAFDEHSICRLASITKNVTRIAALLLVEDGRIELDQPVADVLPEFRSLHVAIDIEKGLASRPARNTMTMRHLITNTSGLGSWTPGSDGGDELHAVYRERGITPGNSGSGRKRPGYGPQVFDLDEMVARVAELPLAYEPGTVLHYSIGFDVMGLVIERVSGKGYDTFLEERLFAPLDMSSTGFQVEEKDAARLTTNYDATRAGVNSASSPGVDANAPAGFRVRDAGATSDWLTKPSLLTGGGGLVSTARDFFRYGGMLLGEGTFEGARVMKPETAQLALSDLKPGGVANPSAGIGAGSRAMLQNPLTPPGTFGGGGATSTLFWIDRARRGNVVFLTQTIWEGGPANVPYPRRLFAAIEESLKS